MKKELNAAGSIEDIRVNNGNKFVNPSRCPNPLQRAVGSGRGSDYALRINRCHRQRRRCACRDSTYDGQAIVASAYGEARGVPALFSKKGSER